MNEGETMRPKDGLQRRAAVAAARVTAAGNAKRATVSVGAPLNAKPFSRLGL